MRESLLERTTVVRRPRTAVFAFFADPANLEILTPPWVRLQILPPRPAALAAGVWLDMRITVRGFRLRWRSEITAWEPPVRFVDELRRGPYRSWIHEHLFEETPDGTRIEDRVRYVVPGGRWVDRLFVAPELRRIFDYRRERLAALLDGAGG